MNKIICYGYLCHLYKPFDKAGSYGIQDGFSVHVDKINGCYYNVMGLPVSKFYSYYSNIVANELK